MDYKTKLEYYNSFKAIIPILKQKAEGRIDYEDAQQIASMLIWSNIEKAIDISTKKRLSLFATMRRLCEWQMSRELEQIQYLIRTPAWAYKEKKRRPEVLEQIKRANNFVSLKMPSSDEKDPEEYLMSDNNVNQDILDEKLQEEYRAKVVRYLISLQEPKTQYILKSYWGIDGYKQKNFRELGEEFNTTPKGSACRCYVFYKKFKRWCKNRRIEL